MIHYQNLQKKQSSIISYAINDNTKEVKSKLHISLPLDIFSDRMGSAYGIDGKTFLVCSSKSRTSVLANLKGKVLWSLESTMLYRVQFIPEKDLKPFLFN